MEELLDFDLALKYVLNVDELQKVQDSFCKATNMMMICFNSQDVQITRLSCEKEDKKRIINAIGKENLYCEFEKMVSKVKEKKAYVNKKLSYENIEIWGIPILFNNHYFGSWIAVSVYEEKANKSNQFDTSKIKRVVEHEKVGQVCDVVFAMTSRYLVAANISTKRSEIIEECKATEKQMNAELKRNTVMTQILQKLEEDNNFEDAIVSILNIVGEYMTFSSVILSKISEDLKGFTVIGKWVNPDDVEFDKKISDIPEEIMPPIPEAVLCVKESEADGKLKLLMENYKVKSMMSVPLMLNNAPAMFVLFVDNRNERVYDDKSKQFILDVCKMIQTIMYKRISKNSLVSSYNALKEILSNIGSGVFVIDKYSKEILFANEVANKTARIELVGKHCWDYFHDGYCKEKCQHCRPQCSDEYFLEVYDSDRKIWQEIKFNDIKWVDGRTVSLCIVTDVTEKKKYQQRIEFQANNDFLTGLYNRMRCEEDLELCIRDAIETKRQGALLFIDLDDFKHINDGLGHQYGDALLKMISLGFQQISEIERRCYRVGGDEFIIIIEPDKFDKMDLILDEIRELFSKSWYINNAEYFCTMSMGIVFFSKDGQEVNDLIKKADIAMYDAKKNGKNRWVYYNKGEDITQVERLDIEKNMRYAVSIGCNEFEIYIQPIVDMVTEKCIGGEALVRWNSGKLGFMSPGDFIPMAENLGLITPIGEYVLRQACIVNKKWSDMGIQMKTNVNLSIIQLLQPDVVNTIETIIKKTGVKPENLVLEVTESLAINDMGRMKEIISRIKQLGVKIALDDFGTGYSSLNYIKQMDFDVIKVDRTFIQDIVDDDYAQAFIKLITDLSDVLGVKVCVEGVEDKEQLNTIKSTKVSMIQGFYFGKPMPIHMFEEKFISSEKTPTSIGGEYE